MMNTGTENQYKGYFQGYEGVTLFFRRWSPRISPLAAIIIVHGLGDHSNRYQKLVDFFISRQYQIYAFDLRGHGQSPGKRGHINNWGEFREDLSEFMKLVQREKPNLPIFLFGHSMGGVITLEYCLRNSPRINGLVCSAPALGETGISRLKWALAYIMNHLGPGLVVSTGLDISLLSRDQSYITETRDDPLYHCQATPRLGMELSKAANWIQENARLLINPLLIVHGSDDAISLLSGSHRFIRNVVFADALLKEYRGGYHELHSDICYGQVLNDIGIWCQDHL
ncbi:MAG: lysophospholipase [Candidatus Cloacimonetes bacterium]|nr:lysophospholipase [Candidatus Cloacimonadota bacterium]